MTELYDINQPFRITGIYTAFDFVWDENKVFKGESHNFWELVTVISGQMEVVEDDRYYILEGGMMVCHAPGEFHRLRSFGGTSPHFAVLTFCHSGELPERIKEGVFSLNEAEKREYLELFSVLSEFYNACRSKIKSGEAPPLSRVAQYDAILRLELFLLRLSESGTTEGRQSMSEAAREYRRLVRTMTERTADNLSLSEIASIHHISESYVKKLFRTYAGEGAMSYYARLRIAEIKRLLDKGLSISECAEIMNFSSTSYLSTFFKKHTGETPCEYAEKNRKLNL